jgi:hypothetical protein
MFLKTGSRWRDCPPEYGPYMTVYNRFNRRSEREPPEQMALDSPHVKARRCAGGVKGGPCSRRSGVTTGGRNSKLQALVNEPCRPCEIILMPFGVADCTVGPEGVNRTRGNSGPALRCAGSLRQQLRLNAQRASAVSE